MGRGACEVVPGQGRGGVQVATTEGSTCWNQGRDVCALGSMAARTETPVQAAWMKGRAGSIIYRT